LINNFSLVDTFDAVEQVLGQQLAVGNGMRVCDDRFVTV
jgi:hypothetical protein